MKIDPSKARGAALAVERLVARGMTRPQAVQLVHRAIARLWAARTSSGLGEEVDTVLATMKSAGEAGPIKAVREAITPWLWVASVVGFGMSILNTRRIAQMFRTWKDKRRAV